MKVILPQTVKNKEKVIRGRTDDTNYEKVLDLKRVVELNLLYEYHINELTKPFHIVRL